ncbi:uncharacterized protein LOC135927031 [Gordionus sp. m RMFG-2023]|uniref:uncharacterized protein LOC135927031 n=1 Tax=Gordionus sp. m RMFG-2023 TaxID=3053472 RepID=UPI0031FC0668
MAAVDLIRDPRVIKDAVTDINQSVLVIRSAVQALNQLTNPTQRLSPEKNDLNAIRTHLRESLKHDIENVGIGKSIDNLAEVNKIAARIKGARPDMNNAEINALAHDLYDKIREDPSNRNIVESVLRDLELGKIKGKSPERKGFDKLVGDFSKSYGGEVIKKAMQKALEIKANYPAMTRQTLLCLIYDLCEKIMDEEGKAPGAFKSASSSNMKASAIFDADFNVRDDFANPLGVDLKGRSVNMDALCKTVRLLTRLKKMHPDWPKEDILFKINSIYNSLANGERTFQDWSMEIPAPLGSISQPDPYFRQPMVNQIMEKPMEMNDDMTEVSQEIMHAVSSIKDGIHNLRSTAEDIKLIEAALVSGPPSPDLEKMRQETEKARLQMELAKEQGKLAAKKADAKPKEKEKEKKKGFQISKCLKKDPKGM